MYVAAALDHLGLSSRWTEWAYPRFTYTKLYPSNSVIGNTQLLASGSPIPFSYAGTAQCLIHGVFRTRALGRSPARNESMGRIMLKMHPFPLPQPFPRSLVF